jgi:hypothetical protein
MPNQSVTATEVVQMMNMVCMLTPTKLVTTKHFRAVVVCAGFEYQDEYMLF